MDFIRYAERSAGLLNAEITDVDALRRASRRPRVAARPVHRPRLHAAAEVPARAAAGLRGLGRRRRRAAVIDGLNDADGAAPDHAADLRPRPAATCTSTSPRRPPVGRRAAGRRVAARPGHPGLRPRPAPGSASARPTRAPTSTSTPRPTSRAATAPTAAPRGPTSRRTAPARRPSAVPCSERRPPDRPVRQDAAARGRPRAGRRVPQGDRAVRRARALARAHPHLPADPARPLERPRRRPRRRAGRRHAARRTAATPSRTRCSSTSPRRWPATAGCGWRSTRSTGWSWSATTGRCSRRCCAPRRSPGCSAPASTTTPSSCTPPSAATSSRRCSSWAGRPRTSPGTSTARRTRSRSTRPSWHLRDYQREAAESFWHGGSGVVVLPCGAGKTLVGAAAMAHAQATTLILVTNTVSRAAVEGRAAPAYVADRGRDRRVLRRRSRRSGRSPSRRTR